MLLEAVHLIVFYDSCCDFGRH